MQDAGGRSWRRDGSGVSPVIGVILLIALAVMLSAIVFLWTGGLIGGSGGSGRLPTECEQGAGNFIRMKEAPSRNIRRDRAEYRMLATHNGTIYIGAAANTSHEGTSRNDWTEFDWEWSPETHETIEAEDSMKIDDRADSWVVGDEFKFTIRDDEGVINKCDFTWQTKDKPEKGN